MIVYLATGRESYTVGDYLRDHARHQQSRFALLPYEELARIQSLPIATYIFSDLDRLSGAQLALAQQVHDHIKAERPDLTVLNNPAEFVGRFDLQRRLYEQGLNEYNVYRPYDIDDVRYPVFLRMERDHMGAKSELIHTREELDAAILAAIATGAWPDNLMVVEFCNTADAHGTHRKYSLMRIGGTLFARHQVLGKEWMLKVPYVGEGQSWPQEWIAEEAKFLETNPHLSKVRSVFDLAGIQYGRIDYGIKGGRVQVWEINTNPVCITPLGKQIPERERFDDIVLKRFDECWQAIDCRHSPGPPLKFSASLKQIFSQPRDEWAWG